MHPIKKGELVADLTTDGQQFVPVKADEAVWAIATSRHGAQSNPRSPNPANPARKAIIFSNCG